MGGESQLEDVKELILASDFVGEKNVLYLGTAIYAGKLYVLYALNVTTTERDGLTFDVGAHYGENPEDYQSGMFMGFQTVRRSVL